MILFKNHSKKLISPHLNRFQKPIYLIKYIKSTTNFSPCLLCYWVCPSYNTEIVWVNWLSLMILFHRNKSRSYSPTLLFPPTLPLRSYSVKFHISETSNGSSINTTSMSCNGRSTILVVTQTSMSCNGWSTIIVMTQKDILPLKLLSPHVRISVQVARPTSNKPRPNNCRNVVRSGEGKANVHFLTEGPISPFFEQCSC